MENVNSGSHKKVRMPLIVWLIIVIVLLLTALIGFGSFRNKEGGNGLIQNLSEPLNDISIAKVDINMVDGNLTLDGTPSSESLLTSGTLQYLEYQDPPTQSVNTINGQATLMLKASGKGQPWFRFPWMASNGATEWQIHLNPRVQSDITAHTGGGNVKLNLAGMDITHIAADTAGGNLDLVLPDNAANLSMMAKTSAGDVTVMIGRHITGGNTFNISSGAGDVIVGIPGGTAARIHATGGMGKTIVDPIFGKVDDTTYQSSNYDSATDKVEININSGAGNISVNTK